MADIKPIGELWEQWANEPIEDYLLFKQWLDLKPKRILSKLSELTGVSVATLSEKRKNYEWDIRADAYDKYLDELKEQEQLAAIKETCLRHAKQAELLQSILLTPARVLAERIRSSDLSEFTKMSTEELLMYVINTSKVLKHLVEVERLAKGLSTENISHSVKEKIEIVIQPAEYLNDTTEGD
ncbi:MAG: hypothetical protein RMJ67_08530 [Elusimicrobiota bacterium]|nr:hypothetical protein [Endomicrobiia bacterium]MDW8166541.1 hypothetical protein [Elusimicrobiota bacterium]